MPTVVVLFNLKPNTSISDFEFWAKAKDLPTVNSLDSVKEFRILKMGMVLGSDKPSPYQYCELIKIPNLEVFFADLSKEEIQAGAKQFNEFAQDPLFIIAEDLAN